MRASHTLLREARADGALRIPRDCSRRRLRGTRASRLDGAAVLARGFAARGRDRGERALPHFPRSRQPRIFPHLEREAHQARRVRPLRSRPRELHDAPWAFEGITSYYDDLALVRCGLIEKKDYLELIGRSITTHLRTPGRARQSLAESSFDAWIKYYRQDENSPNAGVSYYVKGSLVALCIDLLVRSKTRGS